MEVNAALMLMSNGLQLFNLLFMNNYEDDEDDEEDILELFIERTRLRTMHERTHPCRIENFIERTIANSTQREFQSHFRLTLEAFNRLLELLSPHLQTLSVRGRPTVHARKQLLAVLWLLATPESYRSVGSRFDMGKSTLFACFERVITSVKRIAFQIISWPRVDRLVQIERDFYNMAKLRGVVGAIDGTYVKIKAPQCDNPHVYINRKCFHGITLQAVCDSSRRFTDVYTGWPSSVSDARIFKNSPLYHNCCQNPENYFLPDHFIIGDKAYPLSKWCLPPFINRGDLDQLHYNFNRVHAQTRQIIERSFALLFGRFRRLRDLDMNRLDLIPATILACCVFHNICLNHPDEYEQQYEEEGAIFVHGQEEVELRNDNMENTEAVNFRLQLARRVLVLNNNNN